MKVTTDKDGKAKITDLSVGNYTLVEVEAPKGYEKLTNPIPFEITNGMINAVQLEVLNKLNHLAPPGPETPDPEKPGTPDPEKPGTPDPEKPGTPDPEKPGTPDPEKPGTPNPEKPGTPDPEKPGTPDPEKPGTPNPENLEHQIQKSQGHRIQRNLKRITEDRAENACGTIYGSTSCNDEFWVTRIR